MFWAADMFADEVVQKVDNQINFDNFVVGAMKAGILKDNKNVPIKDTYENKGRYMYLYDGLVKIGIIKSELSISTLQTGFYKYTVTTDSKLLEPVKLKNACSGNDKIKEALNNGEYKIDYNKLSIFLKGYSYKTVDQVKALLPKLPIRKSPVRKSIHKKTAVNVGKHADCNIKITILCLTRRQIIHRFFFFRRQRFDGRHAFNINDF
jgi:hypothetical protein